MGKRNEKKNVQKKKQKRKKKKKDKKTKFSTSSIVKKIKSTKIILKKTKQKERKYVKNDNFGKKKKNIWGKLKLDYQPAQFKKNKFDKDNF